MNPNSDYLGMINLIRSLWEKALISDVEAKKSPHGSWRSLARTLFFLSDSLAFQIAFAKQLWYCVLLTKEVTAT